MSAFITVAMIMAQVPATVPSASEQPVKVKKQKPKKICQTVELTGTRVPQRICRNADDPPQMEQNLEDATFGVAKIDRVVDPAINLPK